MMAAKGALLLLLPCAPAPVGGAVTWFSFYDFWIDTDLEKPPYNFNFSQAAQFINLPTVDLGANLQDWKNFARWQGLGGTLDVMWDVEKAGVFTPPCAVVDCSKVERSGLAEGWEAKLDHAIIEAKALEYGTVPSWSTVNISTRAWFLGDELLENGIPVANLTAVARHIKKQWGAPTKIYANLCMPSFIDAANQVLVLTEDERLEIAAGGLEQHEACTCALALQDRVLLDRGERGWVAGHVHELVDGNVRLRLDSNLLVTAESEVVTVPRNGDLYKARQPTTRPRWRRRG